MNPTRPEPAPQRQAAAPLPPLSGLLAPLSLLTLCVLILRLDRNPAWWPTDPDAALLAWRVAMSLTAVAGLWLLVRLADTLLWERWLPRRAGVRIPRLLRQVVAVLLCIFGAAIVFSHVWQLSVGPMLATTGAIGIVAGLALRNVLADFFSGIALNMEHPFRLDDFVLFHIRGKREPVAGFVREINWRSTTVLTPEDNLISVPNSLVAASTVENLSFPSPVYELELDIVLDWHLDPTVLDPVLTAAMVDAWVRGATSGDRPPKFRICKLDGAGVTYRIVYLIDPRKKPKGPARHTLLSCLQQHLRFAGLRPVMPMMPLPDGAAVPMVEPARQRPLLHDNSADRLHAIEHVALFGMLTAPERQRLSDNVRVCRVAEAAVVVKAGEQGSTMFIVAAGVLEVLIPALATTLQPQAGPTRVRTLAPGLFFGEMSLLTGAPRTATVVALCACVLYEVPHSVMAALWAERPELALLLSTVVTEHLQRDSVAAEAVSANTPLKRASMSDAIAERIRRFLSR